jgi:hypothetical protein
VSVVSSTLWVERPRTSANSHTFELAQLEAAELVTVKRVLAQPKLWVIGEDRGLTA